MRWIADNVFWLVVGVAFIWMHLKMHRGHGHGGHGQESHRHDFKEDRHA